MDGIRFGAVVRRLRIRRRLRQLDLASVAGVSRATISRVERGHVDSMSVRALERIGAALDIRLELVPRWRGGDLDRALNSRHAALHEAVAQTFSRLSGWAVRPEVSFAIGGERGTIDVLAWHASRRMILVVELKTEIVDVNELVGTLDRKTRLARRIAADAGWPVDGQVFVSAWVVVAESRTNRRRVQSHVALLRAAYPSDGRAFRGWLARPDRAVRGLAFWPDSLPRNVGPGLTSVRRVRRRSTVRPERGSEQRLTSRAREPSLTFRGGALG
jgi:transcriptional regulator with XRE-family HTH domain